MLLCGTVQIEKLSDTHRRIHSTGVTGRKMLLCAVTVVTDTAMRLGDAGGFHTAHAPILRGCASLAKRAGGAQMAVVNIRRTHLTAGLRRLRQITKDPLDKHDLTLVLKTLKAVTVQTPSPEVAALD